MCIRDSSSITWGDGLLDDSYVTSVDKFLRDNYADTLNWNQLSYHGRIEELRNPRFYLGAAARLQGEGSEASFELEGETLSLCIGIECTGAGACIAEVYDGESLIGSFDTQSPAPARKKRARFTGDEMCIRDRYQDFVFHVKWSSGADGILEVYREDTMVYQKFGPNTYNDQQSPFLKLGVYKGAYLSDTDYGLSLIHI